MYNILVLFTVIILSLVIFCLVLSCLNKINLVENFKSTSFNMKNTNTRIKENDNIDLLTYSKFNVECCPSVYSNSKGCLCFDNDEDLVIITRGGNRDFTRNDEYIQSLKMNKRNYDINPQLV